MNIEKSIMSMAASKSKGWNKNMEMEKGDANQAMVVFFFGGGWLSCSRYFAFVLLFQGDGSFRLG